MSRDAAGKPPMNNVWRRTIFPVLTSMIIAIVGQMIIPDELFKMLWLLVSGLISVAIWRFIEHYLSRRQDKS